MHMHAVFATTAAAAFLLSATPIPAAEQGTDPATGQGQQLFQFHGCVNCHGDRGKQPVSKIVPKIGGMPDEEIFTQAKKILNNQGPSDNSKIMHAAFYSPAQCDAPPSNEELQAIASWLSIQ